MRSVFESQFLIGLHQTRFVGALAAGEVVKCAMQLSNVGTTPVTDLSLKISHPMFFFLQRHDAEGTYTHANGRHGGLSVPLGLVHKLRHV